jgi:hypothetical protein
MQTLIRPRISKVMFRRTMALQGRRTTRCLVDRVVDPIAPSDGVEAGQLVEVARARGVIQSDAVLRRFESIVGMPFARATIASLIAPCPTAGTPRDRVTSARPDDPRIRCLARVIA